MNEEPVTYNEYLKEFERASKRRRFWGRLLMLFVAVGSLLFRTILLLKNLKG